MPADHQRFVIVTFVHLPRQRFEVACAVLECAHVCVCVRSCLHVFACTVLERVRPCKHVCCIPRQACYTLWYETLLVVAEKALSTMADTGAPIDDDVSSGFLELTALLSDFPWPPVLDSGDMPADRHAVLTQIGQLFRAARTFAKAGTSPCVEDFVLLHEALAEFTMHTSWARVCAAAAPNAPADADAVVFARASSERIRNRMYSREVQKLGFELVVRERDMHAQLEAFKASIPPEFCDMKVPSVVGSLNPQSLAASTGVAGDTQLADQIQFLLATHGLFKSSADSAAVRQRAIGVAGGAMPLADESVELMSAIHDSLCNSRATWGAKPIAQLFTAVADSTRHLGALDGLVTQPEALVAWVQGLAVAEMELWRTAWVAQLSHMTDTIAKAIVPGWDLHLDTLMEEKSADVRKAMLSNPHFKELSAKAVSLAKCQQALKKLGHAFVAAEVMNTAGKAAREATQLVSVTYATHQLTKLIPQSKKKAQEVAQLREEMRKRRVSVGKSLEQEMVKLESE